MTVVSAVSQRDILPSKMAAPDGGDLDLLSISSEATMGQTANIPPQSGGQGLKQNQDKKFIESIGGDILYKKADTPDGTGILAPSEGSYDFKGQTESGSDPSHSLQTPKFTKFNDSFPQLIAEWKGEQKEKKFIESIAGHIIRRNENKEKEEDQTNKRFIESIAGHIIRREDGSADENLSAQNQDKRYLDRLGSSLIKREDLDSSADLDLPADLDSPASDEQNKRYIDYLGSSLVKKSDGQEKRYLDHLGSSLVKKSDGQEQEKRYLDHLGSSLVKKSDGEEKRYLDHLGSSLVKKSDGEEKRYLDHLGSSLVKKSDGEEKRYLDHLGSSLVKKSDGEEKRYLDHLGSSLVKKSDGEEKRYLDHLGSSLVKKSDGEEKRYLDHLGSSLVKKSDGQEKRYLDHLGSSLVKKSDGQEKRYLDHLGSSLVKNSDVQEKRYLDHLGSSLVKKSEDENAEMNEFEHRMFDDYNKDFSAMATDFLSKNKEFEDSSSEFLTQNNKRYLDRIGSSLVKKENSVDGEKDEDEDDLSLMTEKRYLDRLGSSLIKKEDDVEKRYLDGIASSLIKRKGDTEKRYLDGIASSLIKKEDGTAKRYSDGIASSLIKKNDIADKRYLDGIASSLIKKEDITDKRYLDGIASSLIKKEDKAYKRYLDGIASSLIKKDDGTDKRYLDGIASSLIKRENGVVEVDSNGLEKRYLDGIASSLIKRDPVTSQKRYLDGIASSLIKKDSGIEEKRYLDGIASSLIKRDDLTGEKRYLDGIASSLIKKEFGNGNQLYLNGMGNVGEKRYYLGGIASSLIKRPSGNREEQKRYLDNIGSSLVKKSSSANDYNKRYLDTVGSSLVKKEKATVVGPYGWISTADVQDVDDGSSPVVQPGNVNLVKGSHGAALAVAAGPDTPMKRMYEVPDDVMTGAGNDAVDAGLVDNMASAIQRSTRHTGGSSRHRQKRARRSVSEMTTETDHKADISDSSVNRQKRFIESLAGNILYRRDAAGNQQTSDYDSSSKTPSQSANRMEPGTTVDTDMDATFPDVAPTPEVDMGNPMSYNDEDEEDNLEPEAPNTYFSVDEFERPPTAFPADSVPLTSSPARWMLSSLLAEPIMGKMGPEMYSKRAAFQKRFLDDIGSSLIKKRYLDTVASSLFKRGSNPYSKTHQRYTTVPEKRFSSKMGTPLRTDKSHRMSSIKRYIDSIASDLLYRKRPRTLDLQRLRSMGPFQMSTKNFLSQKEDTSGRLRNFRQGTEPSTPRRMSTIWHGRPTALTAVRSTGYPAEHASNKAYLRQALREYVNDVATEVMSRTKVLGQSLTDEEKAESRKPWKSVPSWRNEVYNSDMDETKDFFDSLADDILT